MSEDRPYDKLQSAFEALGGSLTYEKADRPQGGAWIAYLSGYTLEVPSTQSSRFPVLDACYRLAPGVAASRSWEDHIDEIEPVGLADLMLRLAGAPGLPDANAERLSDAEVHRLKARLKERLDDATQAYRQAIGCLPSRWLQMEAQHGAHEACRQLLAMQDYVTQLTPLWEKGILDPTVEAIVCAKEFRPLFTYAERATARARLKEFGFEGVDG